MEKDHEARRSVIKIANLAYMVNRRGIYTVSFTLSKYSIVCHIGKTKDLGIATVTELSANIDNVEEMNKIIDLLSKYHGDNYQ